VSKIKHIDEIFRLLKEKLSESHVVSVSKEEIENTPFTTLISCILSLRTKEEVTAQACLRLLRDYNTPEKIVKLSEQKIEKLIYPVGFYKTKAKRIKEISKTILENYSGNVPDNLKELLKLKGVGRKTANVVMVYGHKKHGYIPVDTHCHRIPNRLGWIKTKTTQETEIALKKILPRKYWNEFNELFVIFGKKICLPISPLCTKCPIEKYCGKVSINKSR
jgi:endonuclease-3